MTYQCRDCSYSRKGAFNNGRCPACGSFDISSPVSTAIASDNKIQRSNWRLVILVLLWGILIISIYQKLQP